MKIQDHVSQHAALKELVECFFIIEHSDGDAHQKFLILPSVDTYLSISLDTRSWVEDHIIITDGSQKNTFESVMQVGLKTPCIYEYRGNVKEVCIRFKPLGALSFFDLPASGEFLPFENYREMLTRILLLDDSSEIFRQIELFLLSLLKKFTHPYLSSVIGDLQTTGADTKINLEELAKKYKVSRQTLTNQFKKYLQLSPSEFRQICRFRKFIAVKLADENNSNLTEIVYDIGFFDQSHLIKYFHKYSFLHPLEFFRKINFSDNGKVLLIWQ